MSDRCLFQSSTDSSLQSLRFLGQEAIEIFRAHLAFHLFEINHGNIDVVFFGSKSLCHAILLPRVVVILTLYRHVTLDSRIYHEVFVLLPDLLHLSKGNIWEAQDSECSDLISLGGRSCLDAFLEPFLIRELIAMQEGRGFSHEFDFLMVRLSLFFS